MAEKQKDQAIPQEYELAGVGERLVAYIVDTAVLLVPMFIFGAMAGHSGLLVGLTVNLAYHWYFLTRNNGQTPGKSTMKIRVIKADGTAISDVDAFLRVVGYYVSRVFFMLGFIWVLVDKKNQGWHDKIAGTYVVRAEPKEQKTVTV